jgi:hypothetical protein
MTPGFGLSEKQAKFIAYPSKIDIAEGASGTGKSQALKMKFIVMVNESSRKQHIIAGESGPVAYRNLIDDDLGILALFPNVRPGRDTKKGNHLIMTDTRGRSKIIYIFGFGDAAKYKKVLGSTIGCALVDEGNKAPYNFIVQVFRGLMRPTDEYWMGISLNPDNPSHEIYNSLINKARPTADFFKDIPDSIVEELRKQKAAKDYTYWHFNHNDNPALTGEAIEALKSALLPGSPEYMSLIEGIRAVATGTIYARWLTDDMLYDEHPAYDTLDIGIDIGSGGDKGAKSVLSLTGFKREQGQKEHVFNVEDYLCEESHADHLLDEWVMQISIWWNLYQTRIKGVYVDGAGVSKTLILALADRLRQNNIFIDVAEAWKFGADGGIKARMFVMYALINQKRIHFRKGNNTYSMLKKLVRGDKTPILDNNDEWNDYYDAYCYSWTHKTEEIR